LPQCALDTSGPATYYVFLQQPTPSQKTDEDNFIMTVPLSCPVCVPCEPRKDFRRFTGAAFGFPRSLRLRNLALLLGFFLCAAASAAAQDQPPAQAQPPATAVPQPLGVPYNPAVRAGFALGQWQIADGYQFNRISFRGIFAPFDTNGFNASVTRFFGRELGVEGDVSAGFAPAAPSASAASIFVGGGPHISFRDRSHFEPWVHGLLGVQHFSFGGVNFPASTTSAAWIAGGGLDFRFDSGFALRFQADYLGSHFANYFQRNLQIGGGVVWNF
jgi:hypothetical protein